MKKKTKRILFIIAVIILLLLGVFLPQIVTPTVTSGQCLFGEKQFWIAHRGLSALYPENTVPSFIGAGEAGFYGAECDVHTTSDGVLIVMHDDDVDRCADGEGDIENLTFAEIQAMRIDAGNGIENYPDLKIPTFEEYLQVCAEYGMIPYIELKKLDTKYLPDFFALLDKYGFRETAVLISFDMDYLLEARKLDDDIEIMFLANDPSREKIDICIENGFELDLNFGNLIKYIPEFRYAREKNVKIAMWVVDHPIVADFFHLIGVDYITTNRIVP